MPSLIDLFKNKKLTNGQTAQTNNAVRNGKDIAITTNSILLNKNVIPTFNKLRNGFSVDLNKALGTDAASAVSSLNSSLGSPINVTNGVAYVKKDVVKNTYTETLSEENFLGLRPLHLLSTPFLYGTNTIRLTTQSTYAKDLMIANRNATPNSIGGLISSARVAVAGAVNSVGLYSYPIYPSLLVKERYKGRTFKEAWDAGESMDFIYGLKKKSQGIPIVGDLIKGTLQNFRTGLRTNDAMGQYATSAKALVTKIFLGNNALKFPKAAKKYSLINNLVYVDSNLFGLYGPESTYSSLKSKKNESDVNERNDLSNLLQLYNNPTDEQLVNITAENIPIFNPLTLHSPRTKAGKSFGNNQSFELDEATYNKLKSYLGDATATGTFSKLKVNTNHSLENKYRIKYRSAEEPGRDQIALSLPSLISKEQTTDDKLLDTSDFVLLKFSSPLLPAPKQAWFRSTITGLTETVSPQWDSSKFIGNPFPLYTYNQVERTVQFTFKVYSTNAGEHIAAWERINFLTSLCYPQEYSNVFVANDLSKLNSQTHVTPPFIKFTLGNMYEDRWAIIESLTYTVDDSYPWETGIGDLNYNSESNEWEREDSTGIEINSVHVAGINTKTPPNAKDAEKGIKTKTNKHILPQIIDINISLKIVDAISTTIGGRFYTQEPYTAVGQLADFKIKGTGTKKLTPEQQQKREANIAAKALENLRF